jgi:predicted nucleic acid-binding protein
VKVLVDTCVWSLALQSDDSKNKEIKNELELLIDENKVLMIGPIRQEILSAYKDEKKFITIEKSLSYFPSTTIIDNDYVIAAKFHNLCRSKGIQGSHIEFLICAIASRLESAIFTVDKDFLSYQKHLPILLHELSI